MSETLFILNDAPYGNERVYNALRLAGALASLENQSVRIFLLADAVLCAKAGQKVPEGYYNVQLMLAKVLRKGRVALCGTCMDARGMDGSRNGGGRNALHVGSTGRLDRESRPSAGVLNKRIAGAVLYDGTMRFTFRLSGLCA